MGKNRRISDQKIFFKCRVPLSKKLEKVLPSGQLFSSSCAGLPSLAVTVGSLGPSFVCFLKTKKFTIKDITPLDTIISVKLLGPYSPVHQTKLPCIMDLVMSGVGLLVVEMDVGEQSGVYKNDCTCKNCKLIV